MSGGSGCATRSSFAIQVPSGGYTWWYIDGESEDGEFTFTLIALIGDIFSKAYWRDWQRNLQPDPQAHCALNVVLHHRGRQIWSFTRQPLLVQQDTHLHLGANQLVWEGGHLHVHIDTITTPWGQPLRLHLQLAPQTAGYPALQLHPSREHLWWPVAPQGSFVLESSTLGLKCRGKAYHDANFGPEPLALAFEQWQWQRQWQGESTCIHYDTVDELGCQQRRSLQLAPKGSIYECGQGAEQDLGLSGWGLPLVSKGAHVHGGQLLLDAPCYSRSLLYPQQHGQGIIMHEHMDVVRLTSPWVQALLPYRMATCQPSLLDKAHKVPRSVDNSSPHDA